MTIENEREQMSMAGTEPIGGELNNSQLAGVNASMNSIMNRPAIGLLPNYPKKMGKMFHIELG